MIKRNVTNQITTIINNAINRKKEFVDRSQGKLIDKFIKYIEINNKHSLTRVDDKTYFTKLTEEQKNNMQKGLCFGFSTVHSFMATTGNLEWWENILDAISKWDEKEESLFKAISQEDEDSWGKQTYGTALERAANYVLYQMWIHSSNTGESIWGDSEIEQKNALSVGQPYFATGEGEKEENILFSKSFSGNYSSEMLINLFNEIKASSIGSTEAPAIITIMNPSHAITIRWDAEENNWFLYDPNYRDGEIRFKTKELGKLADQLFRAYGKSLDISIASWMSENNNSHLKKISEYHSKFYNEDNIKILLSNKGFFQIIRYSPNQLENIFKLAESNEKIAQLIGNNLSLKNEKGMSFWEFIITFASDQLVNLFQLGEKNEYIKNAIADSLSKPGSFYSTGFHNIAMHEESANQLPYLFSLAEKDLVIKKAVTTCLVIENAAGETPLHTILRKSPDQIEPLFRLAEKDQEFAKIVASFLKASDKNGLMLITDKAAHQLQNLFKLAEKNNLVAEALGEFLKTQRPNSVNTGLQYIIEKAPDQLTHLFNLAEHNKVIHDSLTNFLKKNCGFDTMCKTIKTIGVERIAHYSSTDLTTIFVAAKNNIEIATLVAKSLTTQTTLRTIAEKSPESLPRLIELSKRKTECGSLIKNALISRSKTTNPSKWDINDVIRSNGNIPPIHELQTISINDFKNALNYETSSIHTLFSNPGPELQALQNLLHQSIKMKNPIITFHEIKAAIEGAKSLETTFSGKAKNHRAELLTNPDAVKYQNDKTGVSNVIRTIGRKLAESQLPTVKAENNPEAPRIGK